MSYPPGPQNPYGQPQQQPPQNPYGQPQQQPPQNPYGQPQQPPQQPYGYPQQQPQQPYGYPQAGGYPAYPGPTGYPAAMPQEMPGMVKGARVVLFVLGGLQVIGGLFLVIGGAAISSSDDTSTSSVAGGALIAGAVAVLALAAISMVLGARMSKGAGGVRVCTIIYASLMLLGGVGNVVRGVAVGFLGAVFAFAIGGFLLAAMLQSESGAWFNRQR